MACASVFVSKMTYSRPSGRIFVNLNLRISNSLTSVPYNLEKDVFEVKVGKTLACAPGAEEAWIIFLLPLLDCSVPV